jgi:hypothetical protein
MPVNDVLKDENRMSATNTQMKQPNQAEASSDGAGPKERHVPTPQERELVESFFERQKQETPAPKMKVEKSKKGVTQIGREHPDATVAHALLANALGTTDADFITAILNQLGNATVNGSAASEENLNFVLSVLAGVAPRDRVEAMLATQMALVHLAAMTFTRRLAHVETIPQQDSSQNALNKLLRTFTNQMETLKRYRSGAQQTVKVEHVHVHEGGQAIVGNVETGGGAQKTKEQAHAELTHAPEQEMRSPFEAERKTVPQRSDG